MITVVVLLFVAFFGFAASVTALKAKYGVLLCGLVIIGPILWTIGACRLGKPGSAWARTFYDETRMASASARYPDSNPNRPGRPKGRSGPPREVRTAIALLGVASVGAAIPRALSGPYLLLAFLLGILAASALMLWHGHRRARATTQFGASIVTALLLIQLLLFGSPIGAILLIAFALLASCAVILLGRRTVRDYVEIDRSQLTT